MASTGVIMKFFCLVASAIVHLLFVRVNVKGALKHYTEQTCGLMSGLRCSALNFWSHLGLISWETADSWFRGVHESRQHYNNRLTLYHYILPDDLSKKRKNIAKSSFYQGDIDLRALVPLFEKNTTSDWKSVYWRSEGNRWVDEVATLLRLHCATIVSL